MSKKWKSGTTFSWKIGLTNLLSTNAKRMRHAEQPSTSLANLFNRSETGFHVGQTTYNSKRPHLSGFRLTFLTTTVVSNFEGPLRQGDESTQNEHTENKNGIRGVQALRECVSFFFNFQTTEYRHSGSCCTLSQTEVAVYSQPNINKLINSTAFYNCFPPCLNRTRSQQMDWKGKEFGIISR